MRLMGNEIRPQRPLEPGLHNPEVPMDEAIWEVVQQCWAQGPETRMSSRTAFEKLKDIIHYERLSMKGSERSRSARSEYRNSSSHH